MAGKPPSTLSLKDEGDTLFEASKAKAQKSFEDFMLSRQQKGNAEGLLESLIEAKTGEKVSYVRLDTLADRWNGLANVLDVGLPLRLVCAIPLSHELAIHRALDDGVVVGERLPILLRLVSKLVLTSWFLKESMTDAIMPRNVLTISSCSILRCAFASLTNSSNSLIGEMLRRGRCVQEEPFSSPLGF